MTPHELAKAVLWGPFDERRARKVRRHVQNGRAVRELLDAIAAQRDAATAERVREVLARVGVTP